MRPLVKIRLLIAISLTALSAAVLTPALEAQGPPAALVETAPIRELQFHDQITLVGRTEARAESLIVAEISGRVSVVHAAEGRYVKKGTPLVSLDCRRVALDLEAKQAEAAQAQADATLAARELERAQNLVKTEIFPERLLDGAEADASRTADRFRELEAQRQRLDLDLKSCTIRAPYNGTTVRKQIDVGEWAVPGTAVFEMLDLGIIRVTVDLPERYFGQVKRDSAVAVTLSGRSDEDGSQLTGRVSGIAPRASEATHTFPVIVEVPNKDGRLGSGMLVRATLDLERTFQGLAVSKDAIMRQGESTSIYIVTEGVAQSVAVRLKASYGADVAIEGEGLAVGQEVVVRGNERIFPGSPVRTEPNR